MCQIGIASHIAGMRLPHGSIRVNPSFPELNKAP
jgi:hypothetical protein